MSVTSNRGQHNGKTGTIYTNVSSGGPGSYRVEEKYFVSDEAAAAVDTRNATPSERPWERYQYVKIA
jgi:hypothetical protein